MPGVSRRGLTVLLGLAVAGGVGGWTWSAGRDASPEAPPTYPPMATGLGLRVERLGPLDNLWSVPVPREWVRDVNRDLLVRFVPRDGAPQRLRLIFFDGTTTIEQAVRAKLRERDIESSDVRVEYEGTDSLRFRLVDQEGQDRLVFYRWFGEGGRMELSLVLDGRPEDVDGLTDLFARLSDTITPIG